MIFLFNWVIFRFHVNFQGCTYIYYKHQLNVGKYTSHMDPVGMASRHVAKDQLQEVSYDMLREGWRSTFTAKGMELSEPFWIT